MLLLTLGVNYNVINKNKKKISMNNLKIPFINLIKVFGALFNPKDITKNS